MDKWIKLHVQGKDNREVYVNIDKGLVLDKGTLSNGKPYSEFVNMLDYSFSETILEILAKLDKPDTSELDEFKQLYKDTNTERTAWFDKANDYACKLTELRQTARELIGIIKPEPLDYYVQEKVTPLINKLEAILEKP